MAQKNFQVDLNLNLNQLLQALLENVTALPAENKAGRVVYLTTDKHAYKNNGEKWNKILEDTDAAVTLTKDSTGLVYTLSQGGTEIGKINIPKDMVVQSGSVVKGTFAQDGGFTESASGKDTALKLVIANSTDVVYINVKDLASIYTGGTTADITVTVSDTGEITATLSQTVKDQLAQIANKVDKVEGKGLSSNDFTNSYKSKLDGLKNSLSFMSKPLVGNTGEISNEENGLKIGQPLSLQCFKGATGDEIIIELGFDGNGVLHWGANTKFTEEDNVRIHAIQAGL